MSFAVSIISVVLPKPVSLRRPCDHRKPTPRLARIAPRTSLRRKSCASSGNTSGLNGWLGWRIASGGNGLASSSQASSMWVYGS